MLPKKWWLILLGIVASGAAQGAVVGEELDYRAGDTQLKGYLAWDDAIKGRRPGVLVVHEWWGLNDYARRRARMLAALGYTALAVDMYGDGRTVDHPKDAASFSKAVNADPALRRARFLAAREALVAQPTVDPARTAAIGYCFGGGIVLNMAREGVDLRGVASFHGGLAGSSRAEPGKVKAQIAVFNGGADPMAPPEVVADFVREMNAAGVNVEFFNYPGAKHAFTNPDATLLGERFQLPIAYDKAADEASWAELQLFLQRVFAP